MGLVQIHEPNAQRLFSVLAGEAPTFVNQVVSFRVPTPDSRLMTSIDLTWSQLSRPFGGSPPANPYDMTFGGSLTWALWLAGRSRDRGGGGVMVPTQNLVGVRAAPLAIPSDINIDGYGDDFEGGQDEIYGEVTANGTQVGGVAAGFRVTLYVRYQADKCEICDDEWLEIIGQCTPSVSGALEV